jgi:hypothetical protein
MATMNRTTRVAKSSLSMDRRWMNWLVLSTDQPCAELQIPAICTLSWTQPALSSPPVIVFAAFQGI